MPYLAHVPQLCCRFGYRGSSFYSSVCLPVPKSDVHGGPYSWSCPKRTSCACVCVPEACIASQTIYTGAKFPGTSCGKVWLFRYSSVGASAMGVCQRPRLGDSAQRASAVTSQVAHSSPTRASHNSCDAIRMDLHSRLSDPPSYRVTALHTKNRRYTHTRRAYVRLETSLRSVGASPPTQPTSAWYSTPHPPAIPAPTTTTSSIGRLISESASVDKVKVDAAALTADDARDRDACLSSIRSTARLATVRGATCFCKAAATEVIGAMGWILPRACAYASLAPAVPPYSYFLLTHLFARGSKNTVTPSCGFGCKKIGSEKAPPASLVCRNTHFHAPQRSHRSPPHTK